MAEKIIHNYYDFLDRRVRSSTCIVGAIAVLICLIGLMIPQSSGASLYKTNVLESSHMQTEKKSFEGSVIIDGEEYKVYFIET